MFANLKSDAAPQDGHELSAGSAAVRRTSNYYAQHATNKDVDEYIAPESKYDDHSSVRLKSRAVPSAECMPKPPAILTEVWQHDPNIWPSLWKIECFHLRVLPTIRTTPSSVPTDVAPTILIPVLAIHWGATDEFGTDVISNSFRANAAAIQEVFSWLCADPDALANHALEVVLADGSVSTPHWPALLALRMFQMMHPSSVLEVPCVVRPAEAGAVYDPREVARKAAEFGSKRVLGDSGSSKPTPGRAGAARSGVSSTSSLPESDTSHAPRSVGTTPAGSSTSLRVPGKSGSDDEDVRARRYCADLLQRRGQAKAANSNWAGSIVQFSAALALNPTCVATRYKRAVARFHQADFEGAHLDLVRVLDLEEGNLDAMVLLAKTLLEMRDVAGCTQVCTDVLEREPKNIPALVQRAEAQLLQQQWDDVIRDCDAALAADPKCALALVRRGEALANMDNWEAGYADWEAALTVDTNCVEALLCRCEASSKFGDWDTCIRDCNTILSIDPTSVEAILLRGEAKAALGDEAGKNADCELAVRLGAKKEGVIGRLSFPENQGAKWHPASPVT